MSKYAEQFVTLAQQVGAIKYGEFTLKSGQESNWFFDISAFFTDSRAFNNMMKMYWAICHDIPVFDVIFGPAYKGIPLAAALAHLKEISMGSGCPFAFSRKESKDHGEGGMIIGAPVKGKRVLIIDDVLTAGTAYAHSKMVIEDHGGKVVALLVALDRSRGAAIVDVPTISIATVADLRPEAEVGRKVAAEV